MAGPPQNLQRDYRARKVSIMTGLMPGEIGIGMAHPNPDRLLVAIMGHCLTTEAPSAKVTMLFIYVKNRTLRACYYAKYLMLNAD